MANGTLKVENIQTSSGSGTITLGQSGETINFPSGVTITNSGTSKINHPAFEAYLSADQSGNADNTTVKGQIDTEIFDTDNCYDNSTNYRFTPNVAGKYFVYASAKIQCDTSNTMAYSQIRIYKNGSNYKQAMFDPVDNQANSLNLYVNAIMDMNGTTDYVELYGYLNTTGSGNTWRFDADTKSTWFGAYRLGVE